MLRKLLSRAPKASSALLCLAVIWVAVDQIRVSARQPLTPWKGGGFGMYTAPHINDRQVWLWLPSGQRLRLHPASRDMLDWIDTIDPASARFLRNLLHDAEHMRSYPTPERAAALLTRAARVTWPAGLDPAPSPTAAAPPFALQDLRLTVTELARRPSLGRIDQTEIFALAGSAAE